MATSSEFDIEVIASDQGLVAQTAVAKVLISILDENDNKPVFSQDTYQAVISEGKSVLVCFLRQFLVIELQLNKYETDNPNARNC